MLLRVMLILAVAASGLTVGQSPRAAASTAGSGDEHACCVKNKYAGHEQDQDKQKSHHKDCDGACLMVCCRAVTAPADPIAAPLDESPLAVRLNLPPLLAHDLGEPQSIFHPPRA